MRNSIISAALFFIMITISYLIGFHSGSYYGENKELRKELRKMHKIISKDINETPSK